jgi:hypothetical protein
MTDNELINPDNHNRTVVGPREMMIADHIDFARQNRYIFLMTEHVNQNTLDEGK